MKKTLIIGSTALDIIINLPKIPTTSQDIHVQKQTLSIGGCAYNVAFVLSLFELPFLFCSPVGSGMYGDYVTAQLKQNDMVPFVRIPDKDSGCCYCFVEENGERTFLSYHGAEYTFSKEWLASVDLSSFSQVYICGLEIEEETGTEIISFLEEHPHLKIYFAPGPRICNISSDKMNRLFALHPVLHLNEDELFSFTGSNDISLAMQQLFDETKNTILVTAGEHGAYLFEHQILSHIPSEETTVVNTIGAGDSHIGTILAMQQMGYSYFDSVKTANRLSAKVVSITGSTLPKELFTLCHFKEIL